jgi:hypothetical protein
MNLILYIKKYLTIKKFIKHNKVIFSNRIKYSNDTEILVEFNNFSANHVGLSYLANVLSEKHKAKIIAYFGHTLLSYPLKKSFFDKTKFFLGCLFSIKYFGVYKSFGTNYFLYPRCNKKIKEKQKIIYKNFKLSIKNLYDLERFKINNILVGDLLYDTYLKKNYDLEPTIDLNSYKFEIFAKEFFTLFLIWQEYFISKKIKAVIASHAVYSLAIPLRLAVKNKIDAFVLSPEYLHRVTDKFLTQMNETKHIKKIFNKIDIKKRKKGLQLAKMSLNNRMMGKYSADYSYVTKSPFGKIYKKKELSNAKIKLLIATHDFVDAPHIMGYSFFTDFYQWIKYLCEISKKTNYTWYVKTHPNFGGEWSRYVKYERKVVEHLLKNYKNIVLLPRNITHNQIANEGITAVLTVNGTVGLDYPLLNIPVINSSLNNPHINYKFNIHPKSKLELTRIILNVENEIKKMQINKKEIYEYYFIKNLFFSKNWLFSNYENVLKKVGGYHNIFRIDFYNFWLNNFSFENHQLILDELKKYISSNNIFLLKNDNLGKF